ncbi:peroxide stress protein YaaA [Actinotalea ferrariae]|uniref:YaaA family protein n=1 Tax=Actinotalea ferrariae TaxID=1386098 RepID=UPI001C8C9879|nr:peroxide stress protein YaaA [Actinotalea ferrariae]MBX9244410.1 peroxide stress protein YaaA [Actinotalea ferrariae]
MLLLLPPSEEKAQPAPSGDPVDLDVLAFPELTATRRSVLDALVETSARPDALRRLMVGRSVAPQVEQNTRLSSLPARPALEVYGGVLYQALGWATLPAAVRGRAESGVVVVSGLWGALRAEDRIPPYRLNVCAQLVGLPALEPLWRGLLGPVLARAAGPRLVVDLRSSSYRSVGTPDGAGDRTVVVRVQRDDGSAVGAHTGKQVRGQLARHLLEAGDDVGTAVELAEALTDPWRAVAVPPPRPGTPWRLDVTLAPH